MVGFFKFIIGGFCLFFLFSVALAVFGKASTKAQTKPLTPTQEKNLSYMIQEYANKGIFYEVNITNKVPNVYVTKLFRALKLKHKNLSLSPVYEYYKNLNPGLEYVLIKDADTKATLGQYNGSSLEMD
jgi:hypothetical protein